MCSIGVSSLEDNPGSNCEAFLKKSFPEDLFINFRKRGREGGRGEKRETHWCEIFGTYLQTSYVPDREWNPYPFGIQCDASTNWATYLGLMIKSLLVWLDW